MRRNWRRLTDTRRVAGVDLARGLAVLGMLAAHLTITRAFSWTEPETWSGLVNGRSSILFATLAGVSVALFTGGAAPVSGPDRDRAAGRLAMRALLLWALGIALLALPVPVYVILPAYGILFLLAIPFVRARPRTLFVIAAGIGAVMPWIQAYLDAPDFWQTEEGEIAAGFLGWHYPFTVWLAFVLCGLAVGRLDLSRLRVQATLLVAGAALAAMGYGLGQVPPPIDGLPWDQAWSARPHSSGVWEVFGSGGFALAVLGTCLVLCRTPASWLVLPLRAVGSMPLTAYVGQLVGWAVAAGILLDEPDDLTAFRALDPFPWFVVLTLAGCTAWAILVGRGPLEWAVDRVCRLVVPDRAVDRVDP